MIKISLNNTLIFSFVLVYFTILVENLTSFGHNFSNVQYHNRDFFADRQGGNVGNSPQWPRTSRNFLVFTTVSNQLAQNKKEAIDLSIDPSSPPSTIFGYWYGTSTVARTELFIPPHWLFHCLENQRRACDLSSVFLARPSRKQSHTEIRFISSHWLWGSRQFTNNTISELKTFTTMIEKVRRRMPWSSPKQRDADETPFTSGGSSHRRRNSEDHNGLLTVSNRPRLPSDTSTGNRPRLSSSGDNSYNSTMSIGSRSKRVSAEEEKLAKARRAIDGYLKKISHVSGKNYTFNKDTGMCYFPYHRFIVVIEVPADHPGSLYIYTCVCKINAPQDNLLQIMKVAMELNYMQHRTRGATLGMEASEVNLCLSVPLTGLSPAGLKQLMDDFLVTTVEVNTQLERAAKSNSDGFDPVDNMSANGSQRSSTPPPRKPEASSTPSTIESSKSFSPKTTPDGHKIPPGHVRRSSC